MPTMQQICSDVGNIPSQKVLPTGSLHTVNCRNYSRFLGTFYQVFVPIAAPGGTYNVRFVPTGNFFRQLGMFHHVYVPAVVIPGTYKACFVPAGNFFPAPDTDRVFFVCIKYTSVGKRNKKSGHPLRAPAYHVSNKITS